MVCLYTVFHNYVRIHKALKCTLAMAAGLSKTLWNVSDLVAMIDEAGEARRSVVYTSRGRRSHTPKAKPREGQVAVAGSYPSGLVYQAVTKTGSPR